ncbi:hypothetical protein BgiMline_009807 [Biomphalaria glabrata]|nr:hypothetical protein BgiMline_023910 [Biomphalaria glabrata]
MSTCENNDTLTEWGNPSVSRSNPGDPDQDQAFVMVSGSNSDRHHSLPTRRMSWGVIVVSQEETLEINHF